MELEWLDDFLTLVRCSSFSQAAEQRNVTQPAFGRRIRALEQWAGAQLFNRSSRQVELSPAGLAFRSTAEDVLRRLSLGRTAAQDAERKDEDTLRLASTHALASTFFPPWLSRIEIGLDTRVSFQFVVDNMVACERLMRQGDTQILLCHHHDCAPAELDTDCFDRLPLSRDRLVPVCAPTKTGQPLHPLPERAGQTTPYLAYRDESGLGRILRHSGLRNRLQGRFATEFHSHAALTLAGAARAGRGAAWVPLSVVRAEMAEGSLVRAGDEGWDLEVEICLMRSVARQTSITEAFWSLASESSAGYQSGSCA